MTNLQAQVLRAAQTAKAEGANQIDIQFFRQGNLVNTLTVYFIKKPGVKTDPALGPDGYFNSEFFDEDFKHYQETQVTEFKLIIRSRA